MKSRKMEGGTPNYGDDNNAKDRKASEEAPKPSRWFTIEYFLWTLSLLTCYVFNFYFAYVKSEEMSKKVFLRGVSTGWLFGREMDSSDAQWSIWRENFPLLAVGSAAFLAGSHLFKNMVSII